MIRFRHGRTPRQRQRLRQAAATHHQQYGDERQQQRNDGAGQRTQAQRTGFDIGYRGHQPQRGTRDRPRQDFGTFGQAGIAQGDEVMRALAQAKETGRWRTHLVQRRCQAQQWLAHVEHCRAQAAQRHRCRQAKTIATPIADNAQAGAGLGKRSFQQRQAGIAERGRVGVGIGQIGGQHFSMLDAGPALADRECRRSGVAGLQRLLHALVLQLLLQLLQLAGGGLLQALHSLVARSFQRLAVGLLAPLLHRAPSEPAGQQDQQHPQ